MNQQSNMFPRFHMGLKVADMDRSVPFYSKLFDMQPTKIRPGYAKFEVREPSVNFTLNQANSQPSLDGTLSHFGIQVADADQLAAQQRRCADLGLVTRVEEKTTCCYALQDKFWVKDPDGNAIEFFLVLDQNPTQQSKEVQACGGDVQSGSCCT